MKSHVSTFFNAIKVEKIDVNQIISTRTADTKAQCKVSLIKRELNSTYLCTM
jgi:hypothetical protein